MIARRALVSGRVQGVGFRFFAEQAARACAVTGWVRNLPDGSVETVVEGEKAAVDRYFEKIERGPFPGSVSRIDVEERELEGFDRFAITR